MAITTLISTTSFGTPTGNYDGSTDHFTSVEIRGDGYLGFTDGLHTVTWRLTGFVGIISVQATLARTFTESDWFDVKLSGDLEYSVDTTGLVTQAAVGTVIYTEPTTISKTHNFTGNFVWVRVRVADFAAGTINSVQISV
jgi:hypothetical protein